MKKIVPEVIQQAILDVQECFAEYRVQEFYIPEMISFDQGYYLQIVTNGLPAFSPEDEAVHAAILEAGFEYLYDSYYLKVVDVRGARIAVRVDYDEGYASIHIFPILEYMEYGEKQYLPLATFTQEFIYGKARQSEDVCPLVSLENVNPTTLPDHVLVAVFKAMREAAIAHPDVETHQFGKAIQQEKHYLSQDQIAQMIRDKYDTATVYFSKKLNLYVTVDHSGTGAVKRVKYITSQLQCISNIDLQNTWDRSHEEEWVELPKAPLN